MPSPNWLARLFTTRGARQNKLGRHAPRRRAALRVEPLEPRAMLAGFVAVGSDAGVASEVRIFADRDNNGTYESRAPNNSIVPVPFSPFGGFGGGVRVALGDFDGDGNDELVTAAGPGGGPHVIVWDLNSDGTVGGMLDSFFAFGTFGGGAFVAAGDLDDDGRDELVVSADAGGGSHVRIYSDVDFDGLVSDGLTDELMVFGSFGGGVRVALGDTNNMGGDELIVAAGPGGTPHVRVFTDTDGDRLVSDHGTIESFFAYANTFTGGVYVAAGPVANAGGAGAEIITGAGSGGTPHVKIFTDNNANGRVSDNMLFEEYNAYSLGFTGGVRVAAGDTDHSGNLVEIITGTGPGGSPHVIISDDNADAGSLVADNPPADQFMAFGNGYTRGIFVAFGEVNTNSVTFSGVAQSIPDNDMAGLTQSIFVPASAGIVRDLDVDLFIAHTRNQELSVRLVHVPTNTTLSLFTKVGGDNDGFIVRLNDGAADDIGTAMPPTGSTTVSGSFNPEGSLNLSDFNNIDASGEWRLTVVDDTAMETGTLHGWSLHFDH